MDFPGRIITAFLAILLLTLFPLQYVANNIEDNLDSHIDHCTEQLSDTIRTKGYLDTQTYETFLEKLDNSGEFYEIEIEDIHPVTGEEVVNEDNSDTENLSYQGVEKPLSFSKQKDSTLSMKISNSTMDHKEFELSGNKEEIQSLATHTHTNDCYAGHRHSSACYTSIPLPTGYLLLTRGDFGDSYYITMQGSVKETIQIIWGWYGTPQIQFRGDLHNYTYYLGDPSYQSVYNSVIALKTELEGIFGMAPGGVWNYLSYTNNKGLDILACGQAQDENPICNQVVTSISATNPTQTIKNGETFITTAVATYLDGHTGIVNCSSNFNPNLNGLQTVTLTYWGLVGNSKTYGTRTCTISLTVINKTLSYITASPSTQIIKKNGSPSYSITAYYSDGTSSALSSGQCSISPMDTTTPGSKTMTISYTEEGVTRTTSITIYVDDIAWISINPTELSVRKYTGAYCLPFTITAAYFYTSYKVITSGYSITGYNEAMLGRQTVTVSYTENGKTVYATTVVNVLSLYRVCPICGNPYDLKSDDSDPGCPYCKGTPIGISATPDYLEIFQGDSLPITIQILFRDGSTSTIPFGNCSNNFNSSVIGLQNVAVTYSGCTTTFRVLVKEKEIICPICGTHYPISEGSCPVCREKVTSIIVTPEEVTVNQNDNIELTVLANYADGSAREVVDWSIDCTTSTAGVFTANVAYGGCTFPIKLTVLSLGMITCPICGLSYDGGEYPNGCPVCSETLTGIEAYLTSGSNLIQYGTTPDISVVLIFRDEHRELTEIDYTIENFDPYRMGLQTLTVIYHEFSYPIDIEVVDNLATVVCPKGHVYYLNEDGSDPGCPFCVISDEHEVVYYYDITYTYEIVEEIYKNGAYFFKQNNYLNISVTKKNISLLKRLQRFSVKTVLLGRKKRFIYGGEIS